MRLRHVRPRHRAALALGASLLAFGLLAAACGSDDSGSSAGTTAAGGGGASTTAGGGAATTQRQRPRRRRRAASSCSASRPTPAARGSRRRRCSRSRVTPSSRSVFDPLALATVDGKVEPYLAESITPNADYTVWTIKARSGVTFHDGTPFDGAAIVDNLTRQFKSFLTGKVFSDVATNADGSPQIVVDPADPMSAQITMKRSWVPFPIYLTGQIGYMASPTWMKPRPTRTRRSSPSRSARVRSSSRTTSRVSRSTRRRTRTTGTSRTRTSTRSSSA